MQIYYIGGDPALGDHTGVVTTDTMWFDPRYARCAILTAAMQAAIVPLQPSVSLAAPGSGVWIHGASYGTTGGWHHRTNEVGLFHVIDSQGHTVARSGGNRDSTDITVYADDGTSSTTPRIKCMWSRNVLVLADVHLFTDASGNGCIDVYENGVLAGSASINGRPLTDVATVHLGSTTGDAGRYHNGWSELVVADFDTRHIRVATLVPTAEGTYTDGAGAYTDVDGLSSDGSSVTLESGGTARSFVMSPVGDIDLPGVIALSGGGRLATGDGNNFELGFRLASGSELLSGPINTGDAVAPTQHVWTGAMLSGVSGPSDLAGIEFMVKSVI